MEFDNRPGGRAPDLVGVVVLPAADFFGGWVATLMIDLVSAPAAEASECTGQCRAGADLMGYGTFVVGFVVLVLMVWSSMRERPPSAWPLLAMPVLVVLAVVGFVLAMHSHA